MMLPNLRRSAVLVWKFSRTYVSILCGGVEAYTSLITIKSMRPTMLCQSEADSFSRDLHTSDTY